MSTREKAEILLYKLYIMRNRDFTELTVEDILSRASEAEINFFYHYICEVRS